MMKSMMNLPVKRRQHRRFTLLRHLLATFGIVAVGLSAALLCSGTASAISPTDDWTIECVDCPPYIDRLSPRAMQLDGQGNLHVVYGGDHLYHAWTEGESWQTEVVDDTIRVGREATLAIDQDDGLHIVYHDEGAQALKYAVQGTAGWQIEELAAGVSSKAYPALAVGPAGLVHVLYYHAGNSNLVYAYLDGGQWQSEVVDADGAGRGVSLALDVDGVPHLSYICDGVCYAVKEAAGWQVELVLIDNYCVDETWYGDPCVTSLALDADGEPHIVANEMYATRDAIGWHTEALPLVNESWPAVYADYSLVLDNAGQPLVAFAAGIQGPKGRTLDVFLVTPAAGAWTIHEFRDGHSPSLTLNPQDAPHVAYLAGMELLHVFAPDVSQGQADWQTETIDLGGDAGAYAALALDPLGLPRAISYDEPNALLRYVEWDGAVWLRELLRQPFPYGSYLLPPFPPLGLGVDHDGITHVVAESGTVSYPTYNFLGYAVRDDAGWHGESLNFSAANLRGHAIALDGLNLPHISNAVTCGLFYHHADASGEWTTERVIFGSSGCIEPTGDYTDLALDGADMPHIGYVHLHPSAGRNLKYAYKDADGWHFDTVDSHGDVGQYLSLALDGADHPRMSYYDATGQNLAYAAWDGADWQIELVDLEGDVGRYTSLAIDGSGHAHISYYDATNGSLKYARQVESGWQIEIVDDAGDVGQYSSLALYGSFPTIAYYDAWGHDLKVANQPFVPTAFYYLPQIGKGSAD